MSSNSSPQGPEPRSQEGVAGPQGRMPAGQGPDASSAAPAVEVRMLTTADLPEVSRLAASVPPGDNEYPIKRLDEELRGVSDKPPDPRRVAFGAFAAGRLLGTGCATPYDDGTGYVSRIYVAHDARKSGVARRVTAAVEDYLRSHGCATAALHFWGPRASTQRIWIRLGYGRNGARGVRHDDVRGFVVSAKKLL